MHAGSQRRRGEPLVLLALVLLVWGSVRVIAWDVPDSLARSFALVWPRGAGSMMSDRPTGSRFAAQLAAKKTAVQSPDWSRPDLRWTDHRPIVDALHGQAAASGAGTSIVGLSDESFRLQEGKAQRNFVEQPPAAFAGRQGFLQGIVPFSGSAGGVRVSRWSADGWVLVRGTSVSGAGNGRAPVGTYGGSQLGVVLRRSLGESDRDPVAFARIAGSLGAGANGYRELTGGLTVRPLRSVQSR